jgi:hypothetical protein
MTIGNMAGKAHPLAWTPIGDVSVEDYPDGGYYLGSTTIAGIPGGGPRTLRFVVSAASFSGFAGGAADPDAQLFHNGSAVGNLAQINSDGFNYYVLTHQYDVTVSNGETVGVSIFGPGYDCVLDCYVQIIDLAAAGAVLETVHVYNRY